MVRRASCWSGAHHSPVVRRRCKSSAPVYPTVTRACTNCHIERGPFALQPTKALDKEFAMTARFLVPFAVLTGLVVVPACGSAPAETTNTVKLQGAGASFPAPLYTKWFKSYTTAHQNVLVDYQSVGSGSG